MLYFYGVLAFIRVLPKLTFLYAFKDDMGLSPADTQSLLTFASIPWFIKPLFAMIMDTYPCCGYRRRPYIVIGALGTSLFYALLAVVITAVREGATTVFTLFICLMSTSMVVLDVGMGGLLVERTQRFDVLGPNVSRQMTTYRSIADITGSLLGFLVSGYLLVSLGKVGVLGICSGLTATFAVVAFCMEDTFVGDSKEWRETPAPTEEVQTVPVIGEGALLLGQGHPPRHRRSLRVTFAVLRKTLKQPHIQWLLIFIIVMQVTPTVSVGFTYFQTEVLHFSPEFLSFVGLIGEIGELLGVVAYNSCCIRLGYGKLLSLMLFIGALFGAIPILLVLRWNTQYLGIKDEYCLIGDNFAVSFVYEILSIPLAAHMCSLASKGAEGATYEMVLGIGTFAYIVAEWMGAVMMSIFGVTRTDYTNLPYLMLICAVLNFLPLAVVRKLPDPSRAVEQRVKGVEIEKINGIELVKAETTTNGNEEKEKEAEKQKETETKTNENGGGSAVGL